VTGRELRALLVAKTTIPGTEGSAVQAQAQRDQTGTGRLQPKVDQKPADQGAAIAPS
jgi:hypothetical protein